MQRTGSTKSRKVSTQSLHAEKGDEALSDEAGGIDDLQQAIEEEEEYDYCKYLPWVKVSSSICDNNSPNECNPIIYCTN